MRNFLAIMTLIPFLLTSACASAPRASVRHASSPIPCVTTEFVCNPGVSPEECARIERTAVAAVSDPFCSEPESQSSIEDSGPSTGMKAIAITGLTALSCLAGMGGYFGAMRVSGRESMGHWELPVVCLAGGLIGGFSTAAGVGAF